MRFLELMEEGGGCEGFATRTRVGVMTAEKLGCGIRESTSVTFRDCSHEADGFLMPLVCRRSWR